MGAVGVLGIREFGLSTAGSGVGGPLSFTFLLPGGASIKTDVSGEARNVATVSLCSGAVVAWSATLLQAFPDATLATDLQLGSLGVRKGASFMLTIPTTLQLGQVFAQAVFLYGGGCQHLGSDIATWELTS